MSLFVMTRRRITQSHRGQHFTHYTLHSLHVTHYTHYMLHITLITRYTLQVTLHYDKVI